MTCRAGREAASANRIGAWLRIAAAAAIFLAACAFVLWLLWEPDHYRRQPPAQPTPEERREIRKLLVYHGLQHEVSIIYGWPDNPYFIRDGKRCAFRVGRRSDGRS